MNWDEKAHKAAVPELLKASQDASHAGRIPSIQAPFVAAAKWQRDQLRTDESVERVARSLAGKHWVLAVDDARRSIDALLREEP